MPDNQQQVVKKSQDELEKLTAEEINQHIIDLVQTPICNDYKYTDMVLKIYLKK